MSCTLDIRPVPMAPTLMRFDGEYLPSTRAGTIVGKPIATVARAAPLAVVVMNLLLDMADFFFMVSDFQIQTPILFFI
jgi:hypothetical protein